MVGRTFFMILVFMAMVMSVYCASTPAAVPQTTIAGGNSTAVTAAAEHTNAPTTMPQAVTMAPTMAPSEPKGAGDEAGMTTKKAATAEPTTAAEGTDSGSGDSGASSNLRKEWTELILLVMFLAIIVAA